MVDYSKYDPPSPNQIPQGTELVCRGRNFHRKCLGDKVEGLDQESSA
jgi:hypothetical protein